jgi:hypothetical protein
LLQDFLFLSYFPSFTSFLLSFIIYLLFFRLFLCFPLGVILWFGIPLVWFCTMAASMMDQSDLQALIAETEALGWDKPDFLVPHDGVLAPHDRFAFVGKLLAQKTHNSSHVRSTLLSVWSFAKPFSMEVLESNKYLFTVSKEGLYQRILDQGPWTIKGSLLLLQPWSSELAIDEVKLQFCAFWVQVHELPR